MLLGPQVVQRHPVTEPPAATAPGVGRRRPEPPRAVHARAQEEHRGDAAEEYDHAQRRGRRPQATCGRLGAATVELERVEPRGRGSPHAIGRPQERRADRLRPRRRRLFSTARGWCGVIIDRSPWLAPFLLLGAPGAANLQLQNIGNGQLAIE